MDAWKPLAEGELADSVIRVASEIADEVGKGATAAEPMAPFERASIGRGDAGSALLFAYLGETLGDDTASELATAFLDRAIDALAEEEMPPSLYMGFTGVAWAGGRFEGRIFPAASDDQNSEIDEALLAHLGASPWPGDYDLISGLVGFGLYAASRLPRKIPAACLEQVVARLAELARPVDGGITWWTPPDMLPPDTRARNPDGYYNLGVAHGVPGVIAVLGAAASRQSSSEAAGLLRGAIDWLMAQQLPPDALGCFPTLSGEATPSRAAWCYGDPGIAAVLLNAARLTDDFDLERRALEIALRAARRPADRSGIRDTALCHGSAGLAHLFNRMFQATGREELREAALFWISRTLEMRLPGHGVAGFPAMKPDDQGEIGWTAEPGFLSGATGVALALLASVSTADPWWDEVLLISGP